MRKSYVNVEGGTGYGRKLIPPSSFPSISRKKNNTTFLSQSKRQRKKTSLREQEDDEKGVIVTFEYVLYTPN